MSPWFGHDPAWLLALAAALLGTGALAGFVAGLLGVGGGIVIVPVLAQLFAWLGVDEAVRMHLAVGTSLASILPTAFTSARAHARRGSVDTAILRRWGAPLLAGAAAGTLFAGHTRGSVLAAVFGGMALLVAAEMGLRAPISASASATSTGGADLARLPAPWVQRLLAVAIGAVSAVMGIGGGTLSVPILAACRVPMLRAVGTASAFGLLIATPGALGFAWAGLGRAGLPPGSLGYVHLAGLVLLTPATVLAAPWGVAVAHRVGASALRKVFAVFLFVTALRMLAGLAL